MTWPRYWCLSNQNEQHYLILIMVNNVNILIGKHFFRTLLFLISTPLKMATNQHKTLHLCLKFPPWLHRQSYTEQERWLKSNGGIREEAERDYHPESLWSRAEDKASPRTNTNTHSQVHKRSLLPHVYSQTSAFSPVPSSHRAIPTQVSMVSIWMEKRDRWKWWKKQ